MEGSGVLLKAQGRYRVNPRVEGCDPLAPQKPIDASRSGTEPSSFGFGEFQSTKNLSRNVPVDSATARQVDRRRRRFPVESGMVVDEWISGTKPKRVVDGCQRLMATAG